MIKFVINKETNEFMQCDDETIRINNFEVAQEITEEEFARHNYSYHTENGKLVLGFSQEDLDEQELFKLERWFEYYDMQVIQYNRSQRLGEPFDKDMNALDLEAKEKAKRIKELRAMLNLV